MTQDESNNDGKSSLAALCAEHLQREDVLLNSALRTARAVLAAFAARGLETFSAALQGHTAFAGIALEMDGQRRQFRDAAARRLRQVEPATLTQALAALSEPERASIIQAAAQVRCLARELADLNYRVSVHVRVHLSAYRRILGDLTNTTPSSGRYGPAGTTESCDYRPLLLING